MRGENLINVWKLCLHLWQNWEYGYALLPKETQQGYEGKNILCSLFTHAELL